ncbi:hypothetical protein CDV31_000188 [Fusarium ambrosium]|uniref:Chitin synthesis regulation, Congo red resistance, RCR protein n=1 Tax=Fusarium ambrosium TaxID=131363 RepID=A0A428V2V3_9HYPO|nr:hypothetical protein CDV31_000188 [Fusarium ambrosium]
MAPVEEIFERAWGCPYGYVYDSFRNECRRSNWSYWGRWVLAGVCIFLFFLILTCLFSSRRRRRRGVAPIYGTGWMAPNNKPWGNNQNNHQMHDYNQGGYQGDYNQQQQQYGYGPPPPPPAYAQHQQPQYTGTTFNPNDGYYGQGQYSGVQPPQGTYQRDDPGYTPPAGPPPGK